ncbi:uncharacterized [Tachysurus ichikawai]
MLLLVSAAEGVKGISMHSTNKPCLAASAMPLYSPLTCTLLPSEGASLVWVCHLDQVQNNEVRKWLSFQEPGAICARSAEDVSLAYYLAMDVF